MNIPKVKPPKINPDIVAEGVDVVDGGIRKSTQLVKHLGELCAGIIVTAPAVAKVAKDFASFLKNMKK